MKKILLSISLLVSSAAFAQSSFHLPSAQQPSGQDRIAIGGFECSSSIASQRTLEFGTLVQQNSLPTTTSSVGGGFTSAYGPASATGGIYARIVVPLGKTAERIDCSRLFQIELEKREIELEMLKRNMASPRDEDFKR